MQCDMTPPPLFQLQYLIARTRKKKLKKFHPNHDNAYQMFPENLGIKNCFILFYFSGTNGNTHCKKNKFYFIAVCLMQ